MQNLNLIRLPDIGKHFRVMARAFGSSFIAVKPACRLMAIISSLSRSEGYTMLHYTHWNLSPPATARGILALALWATMQVITAISCRIPHFEWKAHPFCIVFLYGDSWHLYIGR